MKRTISYGKQSIDAADIKAVVETIKSDFLTQGPKVLEFEKNLARKCHAKFAVVVNSGTAALHTAYFALGLEKNDEFITSPMTFAATSNAGLYLGARPVFVDIEKNGNIDYKKIEEKITKKTKLIVPIHYGGNPADLAEIHKIARKYNLFVIEDACHALGSKYRHTTIGDGTFSEMCVFSFHPVKHITTGEGGAILTNSDEYYEKMLMFRTHGITKEKLLNGKKNGDWYYEMQYLGFNYRLPDIQAALGNSQLKKLNGFLEKRKEIAKIYNDSFKDNPYFGVINEKKDKKMAYHLYPIILKDKYLAAKKKIFDKLRQNGIGVQVHYIPVYFHPYYQNLGYKKGLCPQAEDFYKREISIPMYPGMTNGDIKRTIKTLIGVCRLFE